MAVNTDTLGAAIGIIGSGGGGGGGGGDITVDTAISKTSTNPVQNKAIGIELDKRYKCETMTMAEYEALTQAQKMDGTVRYITDVDTLPDAGGVGF